MEEKDILREKKLKTLSWCVRRSNCSFPSINHLSASNSLPSQLDSSLIWWNTSECNPQSCRHRLTPLRALMAFTKKRTAKRNSVDVFPLKPMCLQLSGLEHTQPGCNSPPNEVIWNGTANTANAAASCWAVRQIPGLWCNAIYIYLCSCPYLFN